MNKTGPNDLCICGSGKKYKKCCLQHEVFSNVLDMHWNKFRKTEGELIDNHLMPYAADILPTKRIMEIWNAFFAKTNWPESKQEVLHDNMFIPWFLFNWDASSEPEILMKSISSKYLQEYGYKLSSYQKAFLEQMDKTYYSFYSVIDVVLEQSLLLRDVFLQTEHLVKERKGTEYLAKGDIIYTRILTLEDQSICIGMPPYNVSECYVELLDYRKLLEKNTPKLTIENIRTDYAKELQSLYFVLVNRNFNQKKPQFRNTDNELIEFHKIFCTLKITPEEAFWKLAHLSLSEEPEEFLFDAEKDKLGKIQHIKFPWLKVGNKMHQEWDNTICGHIIIDHQKLIIEVNSANRAKKAISLLKKHLKDSIDTPKILIESLKEKLASTNTKDKLPPPPIPEEDLAAAKLMLKKYWQNWLDKKLSVLKNKTPRQSAKTKEGREYLESLLLYLERSNAEKPNDLGNPNIKYLRQELGLAESNSAMKMTQDD